MDHQFQQTRTSRIRRSTILPGRGTLLVVLLLVAVVAGALVMVLSDEPVSPGPITQTSHTDGTLGAQVGSCEVTVPNPNQFELPAGYTDMTPPVSSGWFGIGQLWTAVDVSGARWRNLPRVGSGFGQNILLWQAGYTPQSQPQPDVTVVIRQVGAPAASTELAQAQVSNGYTDDLGWFMTVGLRFPESGCWLIHVAAGQWGIDLTAEIVEAN